MTHTLWLTPAEVAALPITNNAGYTRMKKLAASSPSVSATDYSEAFAHSLMANALIGARLNSASHKNKVIAGLKKAMSLRYDPNESYKEFTRNCPEYIVAASLIDYRDAAFVAWLRKMLAMRWGGSDSGTIASNNEYGPGNSAAASGAIMAAAGIYLDDAAMIDSAVRGLEMFCGLHPGAFDIRMDRDLWYYPPDQPTKYQPINPAGSTIKTRNVSGFVAVEMERASPTFQWPPAHKENYVRFAIGVRAVQAEMLRKAGIVPTAFDLGNRALLRAAEAEIYLAEISGDQTWADRSYLHYRLIELRNGVGLGAKAPTKGRCMTGMDWTHPK